MDLQSSQTSTTSKAEIWKNVVFAGSEHEKFWCLHFGASVLTVMCINVVELFTFVSSQWLSLGFRILSRGTHQAAAVCRNLQMSNKCLFVGCLSAFFIREQSFDSRTHIVHAEGNFYRYQKY